MFSYFPPRDRILPPYTRHVDDIWHRVARLLTFAALVLVAMFSGYVLALFGTYGWFIPAVPIVVLAGVALWIAPDFATPMPKMLPTLFYIYIFVTLAWPTYIAFNIPGLFWISMERVALFPLAVMAAYTLATSTKCRQKVSEILHSHKWLMRIFLAWLVWQTLMWFVGGLSAGGRFINQLIAYQFLFLVVAWMMTQQGRALKVQQVFVAAAIIVSAITLWEYHLKYPPWANHIPSFFGIDPFILYQIQNVQFRGGEYRATSVFLTAVTYGEYIGITLPFILMALFAKVALWRRWLAALALALHFTGAVMSNARVAMISYVVVAFGFAAMWIWRRFLRGQRRNDLLATAAAVFMPVAIMLVTAVILSSARLRVRVLGGSTHAASNAGREAQWDMALPVIAKNPLGYGYGSVSRHVHYTNLAGDFTIDSYPINLLVEVGVPGTLLFAGFFITAIVMGVKVYLRSRSRDEDVAGAAALSILSFLITRLVFSSETGHTYVYPLVGVILALWYVQHRRAADAGADAPLAGRDDGDDVRRPPVLRPALV